MKEIFLCTDQEFIVMYALHALPPRPTTVMCISGETDCSWRLSSLESFSCIATRSGNISNVTSLCTETVYDRAEARLAALEKMFQEKERTWLSLHEAWLQEKTIWEASRKELIMEVSRLQDQSLSLKKILEKPSYTAESDLKALETQLEAVFAMIVKRNDEQKLQTSSTLFQEDVRSFSSALQVSELSVAQQECILVGGLDSGADCSDGALISSKRYGNMDNLVDGMQVGGAELCTLSKDVCTDGDDLISVVAAAESNGSQEIISSTACLVPCTPIHSPEPPAANNAHESASSVIVGEGQVTVDKRIELSTLRRPLRRLKELSVHSYVHGALRASHMRWWLKNQVCEDAPE